MQKISLQKNKNKVQNIDVLTSSYTNLWEYNEYSLQSIFFIDPHLILGQETK